MCCFLKGMGAGLVLGLCAGVSLTADKRRSKKMLHRAARNMSEMAEKMADALGI